MPRTSASLLLSLLLVFLSSLARAAELDRKVNVFAWPSSAPSSQTLASIYYNSTHATLESYKSPKLSAGEKVVRVGFYQSDGEWSGVATAASNFADVKHKKILLHVNNAGELYHLGFVVSDALSSGRGLQSSDTADRVSVEVAKILPGPMPQLRAPIVVNEHGQVNQPVVEKSFLQKYWWVIAGFFLVQLIMGGGDEKK